jgi:pimeloyl-ACP methyl ester carboxylesterase
MSVSTWAGRTGIGSASAAFLDVAGTPLPVRAPTAGSRRGEVAAIAQLPRLLAATRRLRRAPRARVPGHVVVDVPGWRAPEGAAAPLRAYLRALGYDARGWGFGVNHGAPEQDAARLADRVEEIAEEHGPVSLVGWSLGGVIAREVARALPDRVARVVTYGTPVIGGPTYTLGAGFYGARECARVAALALQLDQDTPLTVPLTAILTRRDGVVAWEACIDRFSACVDHVEVGSTHLGLGLDPDVWAVVADRLSRIGGR